MIIERTEYIDRLKSFRDKDIIKVVTGLRRAGKSTLFELYIDYLKKDGVKDGEIIQINFDSPLYDFRGARELYDYVIEHTSKEAKKTYVFLDEVQMVPEFQKAVNGLRQNNKYDVYVTGSNAYLLSGELATLLSGRYVEIHMLPLSFREYLKGLYPEISDIEVLRRKISIKETLMDYLNYGGLPQTLEFYEERDGLRLPEVNAIHEYMENILGTIVYKDIMQRHGVTDRDLLERVLKFILDNIGQPISTKRIVDVLNGNQKKTSFYTVENYVKALEECFLIYRADRYDIRGRELLTTGYKYFVADAGLRNYLLGRNANDDIGQLLENVVYCELLGRRCQVKVGKYDNLEVDFVVNDNGETKYYQVSKDVSASKTFEREMNPLKNIKDNYEKHLIVLENGVAGELNGVKLENIVTWLLG